MSNGTFVLALAVGAALLALWIHARFPWLAPERLGRTLVHVAAAFLVLQLTVQVGDSTLTVAALFLLVLPALVYAQLCMLWVVRLAQTALGASR